MLNRLREILLLTSLPLILLATLYLSVAAFWLLVVAVGVALHLTGALVLPAIYTFVPTHLWDWCHLPQPASLPPGTVRLLPLALPPGHVWPAGSFDFINETGLRAIATSWPYVLGLALIWLLLGYRYQKKWGMIAASLNRLPKGSAPELELELAQLAKAAKLPLPGLSVWQNDAPNAFASGLGPQTYMVTITTGLLARLSREEVRAVMAHELGHIAHGDVRLMTLCYVYGGIFASAARYLWQNVADSLGGANTRYNRLFFSIPFVALLAAIFALAGALSAVSRAIVLREREMRADGFALRLLLQDCKLEGALTKISKWEAPVPAVRMLRETVIHRPMKGLRDRLMATHPPMSKRLAALQSKKD